MALWSQIFSALAVGFSLLLAGFLFWMQDGLRGVVIRLKGEQVVTAYLHPTLDQPGVAKAVEEIRASFPPDQKVTLKLVEHREFLDGIKGTYPELVRDLEDLGQEMNQIVPRYVSITGVFPEAQLEQIRKLSGVESAESSGDRSRPIVGAFSALRWLARLMMVGICFALFTGLLHLARMNGYLHQDALGILRLWGADSLALLTPGLISGVMVGALGGLLAAAGWVSIGATLGRHLRTLSPVLKTLPPFSIAIASDLVLVGMVLGLIAGLVGSFSGLGASRQEGVSG